MWSCWWCVVGCMKLLVWPVVVYSGVHVCVCVALLVWPVVVWVA